MTYCVAMKLRDGLVFVADSRTNAGVDIATFRKLHLFRIPGERLIVIQSAGNLATSQAVISLLRQRLDSEQDNLHGVPTLYDAARLLGQTLREVLQRDAEDAPSGHGLDLSCSFLLGGQIRGAEPELFNLYPLGNFIIATEDTPSRRRWRKPCAARCCPTTPPFAATCRWGYHWIWWSIRAIDWRRSAVIGSTSRIPTSRPCARAGGRDCVICWQPCRQHLRTIGAKDQPKNRERLGMTSTTVVTMSTKLAWRHLGTGFLNMTRGLYC